MHITEDCTFDNIFGIRVEKYTIDYGPRRMPRYELRYKFYDGYTELEPVYGYTTNDIYRQLKRATTIEDIESLFQNIKHKRRRAR